MAKAKKANSSKAKIVTRTKAKKEVVQRLMATINLNAISVREIKKLMKAWSLATRSETIRQCIHNCAKSV